MRNLAPEWQVPDDDRVWFEENPRRSHRLRWFIAGEFKPHQPEPRDGFRLAVVVRQVAPGFRIRAVFWIADELSERFPLDRYPEEPAVALFEWVTDSEVRPQPIASVDELLSRCRVGVSDEVH